MHSCSGTRNQVQVRISTRDLTAVDRHQRNGQVAVTAMDQTSYEVFRGVLVNKFYRSVNRRQRQLLAREYEVAVEKGGARMCGPGTVTARGILRNVDASRDADTKLSVLEKYQFFAGHTTKNAKLLARQSFLLFGSQAASDYFASVWCGAGKGFGGCLLTPIFRIIHFVQERA